MTTDKKIEKEKALERYAIHIQDERINNEIKRQSMSGTAGGKTLIKRTLAAEDNFIAAIEHWTLLLYTSDADDDLLCVALGGRRTLIIKNN